MRDANSQPVTYEFEALTPWLTEPHDIPSRVTIFYILTLT